MSSQSTYRKLTARKPPKPLRTRSSIKSVLGLIGGGFFILLAAYFANNNTGSSWFPVVFGLVAVGMVLYNGFKILRPFYYQRVFSQNNTSATATILDKWHEVRGGGEDSYTTFNIAFEFNPIEALESSDKKTLKGEVVKKYWDTLEIGQTVTASYSRDNPEIVILDGE